MLLYSKIVILLLLLLLFHILFFGKNKEGTGQHVLTDYYLYDIDYEMILTSRRIIK